MIFSSWLIDSKIKGINVTVEFTMREYWEFAEKILLKNDLQRKKVNRAGKVYQLLGRDLIKGCVMPPIILALSGSTCEDIDPQISKCLKEMIISEDMKTIFQDKINEAISSGSLIILDGLQRSFTIQDCITSLNSKDGIGLEKFYSLKLRSEIYLGLNKTGILYRMLTLNTGQTPMSLRHQIEMIYQDYINNKALNSKSIFLIRESEPKKISNIGEYKLSDAADMYYAFSTESPNSYSKQTIATTLKESEFLESFDLDSTLDLSEIIEIYNKFIVKVDSLFPSWELYYSYDESERDILLSKLDTAPFGKTVLKIFTKVQVMSGFGSALSKLIKNSSIDKINDQIDKLNKGNLPDFLDSLNEFLEEIKNDSKRVGESQRMFFELFFRTLLNSESESCNDLSHSLINAKNTYDNLYT